MSLICPICKSSSNFVFMEGIFDSEDTNVIECDNCGMRFLDKLMSEEEETDFYRDYYKNQENRQFQKCDLKFFQDRTYNEKAQDAEFYLELMKDKKDVLDVGSGSGGFLRFIKEKAPDKNIHSVEISESNLKFLKDPLQNQFQDVTFYNSIEEIKDKKFDFIASFGVLEHVRDTRTFIKQQADLLKDNSSNLLIGIPNKFATLVHYFNLEEFKKFAYMKMHYYTFSEKSLNIIAEELDLEVKTFNYVQFFGLDNSLSWLKDREPRDFSYFTNTLSEETLNSFRKDMSKNKTTDFLLVVMKKKSV